VWDRAARREGDHDKQTLAQLEQLNDAMFQAYNAHDVAGVLEHVTDDVEWHEPEGDYIGKTEVAAALTELFDAFPDAAWPTDGVVMMAATDHQTIATTFTWTGTYNGLPATGKHVEVSGVAVSTVTGSKISGISFHFDTYDYLAQLGLVPSAEGIGFKMLAMSEFSISKAKEALHL
jgi:steroid delta-isomerase-like uncharacterized protein